MLHPVRSPIGMSIFASGDDVGSVTDLYFDDRRPPIYGAARDLAHLKQAARDRHSALRANRLPALRATAPRHWAQSS
jgi:hypothetical protein